MFYPAVSVTHEYQQGSYKNPALLRHHLRSAVRYFNKWGWLFDAERRAVNRRTLNALARLPLPEAVVEQRK